jgi:DNA modification methylase
MESIALGFLRVLRPGKICAILMGDIRKKKVLFPLGSRVVTRFEKAGFEWIDTIIKEQYNDKSVAFYLGDEGRITTHEYLFILRKPLQEPGKK